jgi:hypothetical protein
MMELMRLFIRFLAPPIERPYFVVELNLLSHRPLFFWKICLLLFQPFYFFTIRLFESIVTGTS